MLRNLRVEPCDLNRTGNDGIVLGLTSAIVGAGLTATGVGAPVGVPLTAFGIGLTKFSLGAKAVGGVAVGLGTMGAGFTLGRQDIVDSGVSQGLISGIPSARQGGITGDLIAGLCK